MAQQQIQQDQQNISNQIAVYQTNKKLIEFLDKLNPAFPTRYAHIHGSGDDGNGNRVYSLIGMVLLDYSNGTGDHTIRVTANLAPEEIAYLYEQCRQNVETIDFRRDKIFGSVEGAPERGIVTKTAFRRMSVGSDGKPRNYPWYVEVQNGSALKGRGATGGTYIQPNSYSLDATVGINLTDYDMFTLLHKVTRYIKIWEMAFGPQLLRRMMQIRTERAA